VAHGTDVLLTTQYLDEADQLASQVVIIDHGAVIAEGTPTELKSRAGRDVIEVHAHRADDLGGLASALAPIGTEAPRVAPATRRVTVPVVGGRRAINDAVRALDVLGLEVGDIALRGPTLDEVFLALTGAPVDAPTADTDIRDPQAPALPADAA
jgi:ABC-2 type transport system ATP-binding protein